MIRSFGPATRSVLLLVTQCALVMAVAGKYLYERETLPRVWVRAVVVDPEDPIRGRYLSLTPEVNACALPHTAKYASHDASPYGAPLKRPDDWEWKVRLAVTGGKLLPQLLVDTSHEGPVYHGKTAYDAIFLRQQMSQPCDHVSIGEPVSLYVPADWRGVPVTPGTASAPPLWLEVTVPAKGALRPVRLASGAGAGWQVLDTD